MRLRFTGGSLFSRVIRIVLAEKGLEYEEVRERTAASAQERSQDAPTLQVPAFQDGKLKLWDSGVIVQYIMEKYPNRDYAEGELPFASTMLIEGRELEDRLQLATLQTLCESAALILQLQQSGVDFRNSFVDRNATRIIYILEWSERELEKHGGRFVPNIASVQDVYFVAALNFLEARLSDFDWTVGSRPRVADLVEGMRTRPSFLAVPIS